MKKIAFVFPGQGAQYIGMGKAFYDTFPESRELILGAGELLSLDMKKLIFEENDRLNITEYTQAAMITIIAAMLAPINKLGIVPSVSAGLSLGEYAALIQSKVLSVEDAITLVRKRGIFMQEEVPVGVGMMAAVLGLSGEIIEKLLSKAQGIVTIANYNCPGQIVISGEKAAVEAMLPLLTEAGAKRVLPLNVSGPFHSPLLKGAGDRLREELKKIVIHTPITPYVANTTAEYVTTEGPIAELLATQVSSSVKWQQSVERMLREGVEVFVEIGPGKTLSSFVKKIEKLVEVINIEQPEDLEKLEIYS